MQRAGATRDAEHMASPPVAGELRLKCRYGFPGGKNLRLPAPARAMPVRLGRWRKYGIRQITGGGSRFGSLKNSTQNIRNPAVPAEPWCSGK